MALVGIDGVNANLGIIVDISFQICMLKISFIRCSQKVFMNFKLFFCQMITYNIKRRILDTWKREHSKKIVCKNM